MRRIAILLLVTLLAVLAGATKWGKNNGRTLPGTPGDFSLSEVPEYSGEPYCTMNGGVPYFCQGDLKTAAYERYGDLDSLGRCTATEACLCRELMPEDERGPIGMVRPSGWRLDKYDFVDGKYLYNRCHLIGYQLTGENANECNLITGTRYLNVQGMLPFENRTAQYIRQNGGHVMYRVTPIFNGDELVCRGVLMEAYSVEDRGKGLCFCVYCYNVHPGVVIDYSTGESREVSVETTSGRKSSRETTSMEKTSSGGEVRYVLNTRTKKIHLPDCRSVSGISEKNRENYSGELSELLEAGYEPCGYCKPDKAGTE